MPPFRYTAALIVAVLIVAGAFAFAALTRRAVHEQLRRNLHGTEKTETVPDESEGTDLDLLSAEGFGTDMTQGMQLRIEISDFIFSLWLFWVPLVVSICLGAAYSFGKFSR